VQADLAWPAPAIAVSGHDACQLWFSLQTPVSVAQAHALLEALRERYLSHIKPSRVGLLPRPDAQAPHQARHAARVPAQQGEAEQWSAFVAPDLAPMFDETPWLDMPPSPEGQADLLAALRSISPAAWTDAQQLLAPPAAQAVLAPRASVAATLPQMPVAIKTDVPPTSLDPQHFLQTVMNDPTVALALRIEAAKALLPYSRP